MLCVRQYQRLKLHLPVNFVLMLRDYTIMTCFLSPAASGMLQCVIFVHACTEIRIFVGSSDSRIQ